MFLLIDYLPKTTYICAVSAVHDGDSIRCASGVRVRVAGIQSADFQSSPPCRRPAAQRRAYVCDNAAARRSREVVKHLVLRKRLTCQPVDTSYGRSVARCTLPDGRSLACATIAVGAAQRWPEYWTRYRMGECR